MLPTGGFSLDPMATATITWRDAQQMPEDGRRYEAVEGQLYVTAAPSAPYRRSAEGSSPRTGSMAPPTW